MQNEPQLSAEMERKAEEVFEHYNGDGYANPCPRIPCDCQVKEYKHFLATALEEQRKEIENTPQQISEFWLVQDKITEARADERKKVLSEVEEWLDEQPTINIFDENSDFVNKKDVRTKLNQLKEGK